MYKIEIAGSAGKELQRIYQFDQDLYARLINAIESLAADPFQGKKLKGKFDGDYSLRVGSYRVVYGVFKDRLLVIIIDVGHRREIYR
jgi:mRNA interferase RelE/StbE